MILYIFLIVYTFLKIYGKIVMKNGGESIMEITKNTKIGELLENAPEKAEVLIQAGMHCLGCPASQAETLEEACDVHGIDVNELVEKLNA